MQGQEAFAESGDGTKFGRKLFRRRGGVSPLAEVVRVTSGATQLGSRCPVVSAYQWSSSTPKGTRQQGTSVLVQMVQNLQHLT